MGLAQFLEGDLQLVVEIQARFGALGFFIICSDCHTTAKKLIANSIAHQILRQGFNEPDNARPVLQQARIQIPLSHGRVLFAFCLLPFAPDEPRVCDFCF